MIALYVETLTAICNGSHQDRFPRPVIVLWVGLRRLLPHVAANRYEIEYRSRELTNGSCFLVGDVARHRQRFQINFGPHDGGAEVEHNTAFEPGDRLRQNKEVSVTGLPECGAIAIGMLVNDVVADADVNGDRHAQSPGRR